MGVVLYYAGVTQAYIDEIFSSLQGEGPFVGQRHLFVRFLGCELHCRYCDTPAAVSLLAAGGAEKPCRVQGSLDSSGVETIANPVSSETLTRSCLRLRIPGPGRPWLSLTGGEPLLQKDFLGAWLPEMRAAFQVYLETSGIHPEAMQELKHQVDVVSMDFKLPSATGLRPFWDEHRKFLAAASGAMVFAKAVLTADTTRDDIMQAVAIIAEQNPSILLVLQPAAGPLAPGPEALLTFQRTALGIIADVRVIPQAHKILNVP